MGEKWDETGFAEGFGEGFGEGGSGGLGCLMLESPAGRTGTREAAAPAPPVGRVGNAAAPAPAVGRAGNAAAPAPAGENRFSAFLLEAPDRVRVKMLASMFSF